MDLPGGSFLRCATLLITLLTTLPTTLTTLLTDWRTSMHATPPVRQQVCSTTLQLTDLGFVWVVVSSDSCLTSRGGLCAGALLAAPCHLFSITDVSTMLDRAEEAIEQRSVDPLLPSSNAA